MPTLVIVFTCCSVGIRAGRWSSCQVRSCSSVDQRLGLLPMTLSWRFLLILGPERARQSVG